MRNVGFVAALLLGTVLALHLAGRAAPEPAVAQQNPKVPPLPGAALPPSAQFVPPSSLGPTIPTGPTNLPTDPPSLPPPIPHVGRVVAPPIVGYQPDLAPPKPSESFGRASVRLAGGSGMKVSWELDDKTFHDHDLVAPASYNFVLGRTYRLRLSNHPRFPERAFYPTLELPVPADRTRTFLAHCAIPVSFTEAELVAAAEGRLVVKTVYLPGRSEADATEEVSSLKVGFPQVFDTARGTPLAVVRFGNIDLETPNSPRLSAAPNGADVPLGPAIAPLPHAR